MEEHPQPPQQEEAYDIPAEPPRTPAERAMQLKVFVWSWLCAGGIDLVIHQGWQGMAIGTIAAFFLAYKSPEMREALLEELPLDELKDLFTEREPGSRSLLDRLLGRHYDPEENQLPPLPAASEGRYDPVRHQFCLNLAAGLYPHANSVLSNRINILGMPGAGKSNAVAVLCEEIAKLGAPLILFDHKPEYARLCDRRYFPTPFLAGVHNVTPAGAFAFGQRVMEERLQVVLDLRSYRNDNAAAQVMIGMIEGVSIWQEALSNQQRTPCTFVLDEAHYWLPETESMSTVSRTRDKETGTSLFGQLQQTFFNLVTGGRSFGMGIILSTQRPADIDKRAISVAEWRFLLKATMPNDLRVYRDFGLEADMAMALSRGEAYVRGPGDIRGVFQMRRRNSPDDAQTPGVEALQRPPVRPLPEHIARYASPRFSGQAGGAAPSGSPSPSPSQASSVSASDSTSSKRAASSPVEGANDADRSGSEGAEVAEGEKLILSERERRIGKMFFVDGASTSAIVKVMFPDATGGDKYQRASTKVADALRKYFAVMQKGGQDARL